MDKRIVKYYVYHIPKRKEWGCTKNINLRLKQLGYTDNDLDRIIICENIDTAAELEKRMNIEYGYGWNETRDYRIITNVSKTGYIKGGEISKEKNSKIVLAFDKITGNFVKEYYSIKECARDLNVNHGWIHNILKGRRKSVKGLIIKYK